MAERRRDYDSLIGFRREVILETVYRCGDHYGRIPSCTDFENCPHSHITSSNVSDYFNGSWHGVIAASDYPTTAKKAAIPIRESAYRDFKRGIKRGIKQHVE